MNLRVLKKDVDFLIEEFMSDALLGGTFSKDEKKQEEIMGLITEAIELREDTYLKINNPDKSKIKAYYRGVNETFYKSVDGLFDKLAAAVK